MPSRMIRDSACTSRTLAVLSDAAERLWWRLLTHTDGVGLFDAEPRVVLGSCAPLLEWSSTQIEELLGELQSAGLVHLYQVGGRHYGQVLTFAKHNKIRKALPRYPIPQNSDTLSIPSETVSIPSDTLPLPSNSDPTRVGSEEHPFNSPSLSLSLSHPPRARDPGTTESELYQVADALARVVFSHNPQHRDKASYEVAARQKWCMDIVTLLRDGVTVERALAAIAWLGSDAGAWWRGVITDGVGLVKNFSKLEAKALAEQQSPAAVAAQKQKLAEEEDRKASQAKLAELRAAERRSTGGMPVSAKEALRSLRRGLQGDKP